MGKSFSDLRFGQEADILSGERSETADHYNRAVAEKGPGIAPYNGAGEYTSDYVNDNHSPRGGIAKMNPKHIRAMKDGKAPMEYLVWSVLEGDARTHKGGADKYGIRNWRQDKILASTYEGAIMRHFTAWAGGQDFDPDSGYSHLYHIRCCCAILLDSEMHGTLIDDRRRVDSIDASSE